MDDFRRTGISCRAGGRPPRPERSCHERGRATKDAHLLNVPIKHCSLAKPITGCRSGEPICSAWSGDQCADGVAEIPGILLGLSGNDEFAAGEDRYASVGINYGGCALSEKLEHSADRSSL